MLPLLLMKDDSNSTSDSLMLMMMMQTMGNQPIGMEQVKYMNIETIRASNRIFDMPFLRNEVLKIFEKVFTMAKLKEFTHIYGQ